MSINTAIANGVLTVEIARPDKKNALTLAMYEQMIVALRGAAADKAVRAVIFTGQGGSFTSGNDLQDFMDRPPTGADSPVVRFILALAGFEKPVIAAVTGAAVGIGTTMLFHCDLVYLGDDTRLAMPFVALGLAPEFASSFLAPRVMGYAQASEKLLLGTPFTAAEALEFGIANAVLSPNEVLPHARRVAERFNALPAAAVRDTKRLLRAPLKDAVSRAINSEIDVFTERLKSPEAKEAFRAFFEKRKPDFSRF